MIFGIFPFLCTACGVFKLRIIQLCVESIFCQEFFVVSLFDNIAVFHYQYKICISDGGESVGDYEAGSAFHEVIHGFLDLDFGSGVYGAGGFV